MTIEFGHLPPLMASVPQIRTALQTDLTLPPRAARNAPRKHPTREPQQRNGRHTHTMPSCAAPRVPEICAPQIRLDQKLFPQTLSNVDYLKMRRGSTETSWVRSAPADHCTSYGKPTWNVRENSSALAAFPEASAHLDRAISIHCFSTVFYFLHSFARIYICHTF